MGKVLVGTCNWADFTEWYPRGVKPTERIRYYAQHFPVVEIDSTFYHLMPRRNFEGWAEKTPEGFVFDVKAYRTLTRHGAAYEPGKVHADADPEYDPSEDDFEKFKYQIEPLRDAASCAPSCSSSRPGSSARTPTWSTSRPAANTCPTT